MLRTIASPTRPQGWFPRMPRGPNKFFEIFKTSILQASLRLTHPRSVYNLFAFLFYLLPGASNSHAGAAEALKALEILLAGLAETETIRHMWHRLENL